MKLKRKGFQSISQGLNSPSKKGKPLLIHSNFKPIKAGSIIDIIAPSSTPKGNEWKKGVTILKQWGFKPRLMQKAFSPWLFHADKNKNRSTFLNKAFFNKTSSVVWMIRGGYGMAKIMPSFIKTYSENLLLLKKKLFIGYSDGTALHLYLNGQNQATLHAPLVSELADLSQKDLSNLKNILLGVKKEILFNKLRVFPSSFVRRREKASPHHQQVVLKSSIIGGNLSLLSSSVGTAWQTTFAKHFLFVEDINEADYRVDRLLHHLFYSGALKSVKAILFGCFSHLNRRSSLNKVLKSFSDVCDIPLVLGLPCGHIASHQPLPFKTPAELIIKGTNAKLKVKL